MGLEGKCIYEIMEMRGKGLAALINIDKDGIQLLQDMLRFSPKQRISPAQALKSPFFDEIRDHPSCLLTPEE